MNVARSLAVYDFSKPLDYSIPFSASTFGFYSTVTRRAYYLNPASIVLSQLPEFSDPVRNSTIGAIYVNAADMLNIKLLDIEADSFFAVVASGSTLVDHDGYALNELPVSKKLLVSDIILDDEPPAIITVVLDLSREIIQINVRIHYLYKV